MGKYDPANPKDSKFFKNEPERVDIGEETGSQYPLSLEQRVDKKSSLKVE
jgi:hypothetical protein